MWGRDRVPEPEETLAVLEDLQQENARLRERLEALCQAADLWISLYERQLERANRLAAECRRLREEERAPEYRATTPSRPLRMTFAGTPPDRRKTAAAG